jgi:uncharacterized RDD family membrane protein YckC
VNTALSASQQDSTIPPTDGQGPDWKRQLAERLEAYRSKHPETNSQISFSNDTFTDSRTSRIARSVALRYASAPTYSELLLARAEADQAEAAAQDERAAHEAHLAQEKLTQEKIAQEDLAAKERESERISPTANENTKQQAAVSPTQPGTPVMPAFAARSREMKVDRAAPEPEPTLEDLWASALVEPRSMLPSKLIEFPRELISSRRARLRLPEGPEEASTPAAQQAEAAQLRIFEVQPEGEQTETVAGEASGPIGEADSNAGAPIQGQSSEAAAEIAPADSIDTLREPTTRAAQENKAAPPKTAPPYGKVSPRVSEPAQTARVRHANAVGVSSGVSSQAARSFKSLEWAAISLDKEPATRIRGRESSVAECVPFLIDPAGIDRRLMAIAVDFAAVTAGFLGFLMVFVACTPHLPSGLTAAALAAVVYGSLWLLYQMLFFSFSGATAGMMYARIALCTFDDQNPTRPALRRRVAAWWLSGVPLGLGFLWCFVDEDNLSWHDRMTRTYQRTY